MLTFDEITDRIRQTIGPEAIAETVTTTSDPFAVVPAEHLQAVCLFLRDTEGLYFDSLSNLSGMDYSATEGWIGCVYHLYSIPYNHRLVLKCKAPAPVAPALEVVAHEAEDGQPVFELEAASVDLAKITVNLPSVSSIWRTADWHEREAYDLFGIVFDGHPDLRRILLPADWDGFPLRKKYTLAEAYHGIPMATPETTTPFDFLRGLKI